MKERVDLSRFVEVHKGSYKTALKEIRDGRKQSHWMWYIFPQIAGLGMSPTSQKYAIRNPEEAKAFLNDSYLGKNLLEITGVLLTLRESDAAAIFGRTDEKKLRSCMTLFAFVSEEGSVFHQVLHKYFNGKLGGAFATEQFTHGGGEAVIESILIIEMVNGMLCYSGGGACGMPVIHLGPVGVNNNVEKHNGMELYRDNFIVFGERFAKKASEIFG